MKLAVIGDYNDNFRPHKATNEAIKHSIEKYNIELDFEWFSTDTIKQKTHMLLHVGIKLLFLIIIYSSL
jgi:CTP synthase (UTP-ammonia lyase)